MMDDKVSKNHARAVDDGYPKIHTRVDVHQTLQAEITIGWVAHLAHLSYSLAL
jgi:hypothetical protein